MKIGMVHMRPCPFCGSEDLCTTPPIPGDRAVVCGGCKCAGPMSPTEVKALVAWNMRGLHATSYSTEAT